MCDLAKGISKEFDLAVACCTWPVSEESNLLVQHAAKGVNWQIFLQLARRHRIQGLVWHSLKRAKIEVPVDASAALAAAAAEIAQQNLVNCAETLKLQQVLSDAGAKPLFLKGVSLGMIAYGTLSVKMGWDIDIIISSEKLGVATKVLRQNGYLRTIPGDQISDAQLNIWHRHWKESVWQHESGATYVELHTELVDNPLLLPGMGALSPSQGVELARGASVKTLATDELFAYLCVHGASSGWFRLKWLADLAALLAPADIEENERLYQRSQQLGAGRAADQALLLANFFFKTKISPTLRRKLQSNVMTRILFRSAIKKMAGRHATVELHDTFLGTASIHAMQLGLLPGWRFKISEIARQSVDLVDRIVPYLPTRAHFLYRWLLKRRPLRRYK